MEKIEVKIMLIVAIVLLIAFALLIVMAIFDIDLPFGSGDGDDEPVDGEPVDEESGEEESLSSRTYADKRVYIALPVYLCIPAC